MKTYLLVSETNYFIKEKLKELTNNITNIILYYWNTYYSYDF